MPERLRRWAWTVVVLSLLPAAWLVVQRVGAEGQARRVAVVMDEQALRQQAAALGVDPFELASDRKSVV